MKREQGMKHLTQMLHYKAGAQIFPYLIPSELRKNEMAYQEKFLKNGISHF